jgi:hypothetical protein
MPVNPTATGGLVVSCWAQDIASTIGLTSTLNNRSAVYLDISVSPTTSELPIAVPTHSLVCTRKECPSQLMRNLLSPKIVKRFVDLNCKQSIDENMMGENHLLVTRKVNRPDCLSIFSMGTICLSSFMYLHKPTR